MNTTNYFGETADNETLTDRRATLHAECIHHEQQVYNEPLTAEELDAQKNALVQLSVQFERLADEKKEAMASFKDQMDPIALQKKQVLNEVKNGSREAKGDVFYMPNYDTRQVAVVAADGRILYTRAMTPAERQRNLFVSGKDRATGTDN